jgi:hypothetical protein
MTCTELLALKSKLNRMALRSRTLCDVLLNQLTFMPSYYDSLLWFKTTQASKYEIDQGTISGYGDGLWVITTKPLT